MINDENLSKQTNKLRKLLLVPYLSLLGNPSTHPLFLLPRTLISSINLACSRLELWLTAGLCHAKHEAAAVHLKRGRLLHCTPPQGARPTENIIPDRF